MRYIVVLIIIALSSFQVLGQPIPVVAKNQCISLDKPVYCSGTALNWSSYASLSDGDDGTILEVASPVTMALQVDAQTSDADSLILHWRAQSWGERDDNSASLKHYKIYTSDNSTNGINGDWQFVLEKTNKYKDNFVFFPNNQPKWVKVVELGSDTLKLARLEVFQSAPAGKKNDIWLFFGDSWTLGAMGAGNTNYNATTRFSNQIHEDNPCYYPMIINGGLGGETATHAVTILDKLLDDMPQVSFVASLYGVNDMMYSIPPLVPYDDPLNDISTAIFLNAYLEIMNICRGRGVFPIPARIPWVHFPNVYSSYVDTSADKTNGVTPINLNEIDTLIKQFAPYAIDTTTGIPYGDFETWFRENRDVDQVFQEDFVHLYGKGVDQFNKIWVNTAEHIIYTNDDCDTTGELTLFCPGNRYIQLADTATEVAVEWTSPVAISSCGLGNSILLTQVEGDSIQSSFSMGNYYIAYKAEDYCGESAICRFSITIQPPPEAFDCGQIDGYTKLGEMNNHGYYLSENTANWKNARDSVNALGGYLATISSPDENELLHAALNQETAFIGIYDFLDEGYPEWANGEPVTLDLSFDNTPENDFGVINFWAGTWGLTNQWVGQKYIMEKECDILDLSISCPENLSIQLPIGQADTTFFWIEPTASTTCDTNSTVLLTQVEGEPNGATLSFGTYGYTWNAADSCGNTASCSWSISVDTTPITGELSLVCPDDIDVLLPFGQIDTLLNWDEPTYSTTCNVSEAVELTQIAGPTTGSIFEQGQSTVTYTAADSCGNVETCSLIITVDTTPVTGELSLVCPDDIKVEVAIGQLDTILNWEEPTKSTTCNAGLDVALTQIQGPINGTSIPLGVSDIVYMAKDSCGNEKTCGFSITVTQKPDAVVNISQNGHLDLSPNPVHDDLLIEWMNFTEVDADVSIFSSQGRLIYLRKRVGSNPLTVDVSSFQSGLYFIQVTGVGQIKWGKFIKD